MVDPPDADSGELDPASLEATEFGFVRHGADPAEVRSLLARVADEFRLRGRREHELTTELREAQTRVADLEAAARDLEERSRAAEDEVSARADEAAARAEEEATARLDAAKQEGRELVEEARVVRRRMLEDLARRRKGLRHQIDQLRAGRERLLEAYEVVGQTMGEATDELNVALPEARAAADRAAHATTTEESVEELEAEIEAARHAGLPIVAGHDDSGPDAARARSGSSEVEGERPQARSAAPLERDVRDMPEVEPVVSDFEDVRFIESEPAAGAPEAEAPPAAHQGPTEAEAAAHIETDGPVGAEPGLDAEDSPVHHEGGSGSTDLFDRLREETEAADESGPSPSPVDTGEDDQGEEFALGGHDEPEESDEADRREPFHLALTDDDGRPPGPGEESDDEGGGAEDQDPTEAMAHDLARRLKRLLSDEQNDLLDRLRQSRRRSLIVADLLDDLDTRVSRFADAVEPHLVEAADGSGEVDDLAAELAREVAEALADALDGLEAAGADERDAAAGDVRRCYRIWKSDRIGAVAHRYVEAARAPEPG